MQLKGCLMFHLSHTDIIIALPTPFILEHTRTGAVISSFQNRNCSFSSPHHTLIYPHLKELQVTEGLLCIIGSLVSQLHLQTMN